MEDDFFNQSSILIKNIKSVFQYILTKPFRKVLTVFGEYHDLETECKIYNISVLEYINRTLRLNKKVKIFLEYDSGSDVKSLLSPTDPIRSINIREILGGMTEEDRKKHIVPVDCRNYYLTPYYHHELYNNLRMNMDKDYITTNFIDKFLIIRFDREPSVSEELQGILNKYLEVLYNDFTYLKHNWDIITNPPGYDPRRPHYKLELLRFNWARVVDFYIIQELFKNDDTVEYICIIGDNHRINIQEYISKLFDKKIRPYSEIAGIGECVSMTKMPYGEISNTIESFRLLKSTMKK
jgi:hypothetical protein